MVCTCWLERRRGCLSDQSLRAYAAHTSHQLQINVAPVPTDAASVACSIQLLHQLAAATAEPPSIEFKHRAIGISLSMRHIRRRHSTRQQHCTAQCAQGQHEAALAPPSGIAHCLAAWTTYCSAPRRSCMLLRHAGRSVAVQETRGHSLRQRSAQLVALQLFVGAGCRATASAPPACPRASASP